MSATDASQDAAPAPLPPKVAPESLELRAQPRPVTRLNPRMLAVLAGGLASAVLGALLWSLQPQQRREDAEQRELYNVDRVTRPRGWISYRQTTAVASSRCARSAAVVRRCPATWVDPSSGPSRHRATTTATLVPTQPKPSASPGSRRLRKSRCRRCFSALVAGGHRAPRLLVRTWPDRGFDPLATGSASTTAAIADAAAPQNRQEQKEAFLRKSANAQIRNSGFLQMPDSPYQVMAGTVIAAALVTGIKSDLPGDVIATVTEPVYDSASGQHVLIPRARACSAATTAR